MTDDTRLNREYLAKVLYYFPAHIKNLLTKHFASITEDVNELRVISGGDICYVSSDKVSMTGIVCSHSDMRLLVMSLCGNSMYSHTDTICEGYVVTSDGIRAGIAGKAVCSDGVIKSVVNIAAVVIRIPSVRRGFADELYGVMKERSFHDNVLVYSPPSGGKTTLLRELAYRLSSEDDIKKTVVVDTRYEISEGLSGSGAIILYGYPRAKGIEIAVRTLSADVVICDEIGNDEDFEAVSSATGSGTAVVASCHSDKNGGGIMIEKSKERGLFNVYYGINRYGRGHIFCIDTDKV